MSNPSWGGLPLPSYVDPTQGVTEVVSNFVVTPGLRTFTVPGAYYYIVLTVQVWLTTSAAAGSRAVGVTAEDPDGNVIWVIVAGVSQAASLAYRYLFSRETSTAYGPVGASNNLVAPLPPNIFPPGYSVVLGTGTADLGDTWSNMRMTVVKFPTGPTEIHSEAGGPQALDLAASSAASDVAASVGGSLSTSFNVAVSSPSAPDTTTVQTAPAPTVDPIIAATGGHPQAT